MDTRILLLKLLVLLGVFQCQAVEWRVYKGSTNYVTVPFNKICGILPHIKPNKPCVFLAFGSSLPITGPAVESIVSALVEARQYNVVLLDWSRESKVTNMGRSLRNASRNAIKIGCEVGRQLGRLVRCGLDAKKIYLIGHSLAGHLMGEAGRCALDNRVLVPRITGLDPPGKLFEGAAKFPALDKTCAFFVDVIHTDPLGYGARSSMGTVDIYPNYSPSGKKQPGCPVGKFKQLSPNDLCSHNRAVLLFIEGIRNPHSLTAANADSYNDWLRQRGHNYDVTYIGPLTDFSAIGNYYLRTNAQYPYSKGMAGQRPPKQ